MAVTNVNDEVLSLDGSNVQLTNGFNLASTVTNNLEVSVNVMGTTATVSFSSAALNATQLQTLINGLTYNNTSDTPSTTSRVATVTSLTDSGSSAGANENAATLTLASTVSVAVSNDSPVISNLNGGSLTYNEGSGAVVVNQGTAATLVDPDSANLGGGNIPEFSLVPGKQSLLLKIKQARGGGYFGCCYVR